jgi:predicted amino acid-binding ACT domain protein
MNTAVHAGSKSELNISQKVLDRIFSMRYYIKADSSNQHGVL